MTPWMITMLRHRMNNQYRRHKMEDINQVKEKLAEKIMTTIFAMTHEELIGMAKLFGTAETTVGTAEKVDVLTEDSVTEEETMVSWITKLIKSGSTAESVIEFLLTGSEDAKSRLVSILSVLGYQLKTGVDYTEDLLHKVTIQALIKKGALPSDSLLDITEERTQMITEVKIETPTADGEAFDYRKVKVNKPTDNGVPIDQQINELILKIGGEKLTGKDLIMIAEWNELYTPIQIFQALQKTFDQGVFSLKSTNARLKVDFPPEGPENISGQTPSRVGKFGLGAGEQASLNDIW